MGSAGAAATALSELFANTRDDDDLGGELMPPFEPTRGLPELFTRAERLRQAQAETEEDLFAELRREYPGVAGAVIMQDAQEA